MERHFNLRNARVLVALTAVLLVGATVTLLCCAQPQDRSEKSCSGVPLPTDEEMEAAASNNVGREKADEGDGLESDSHDKERRESTSEPDSDSENAADQDEQLSEHSPETIEPAGLAAGDEISVEDVERAGGAAAFFWAEPVSDTVFARMKDKSFGEDCTTPRDDLRYLRLLHVDAEGHIKVGELVVHRNVADEVLDIFSQLYEAGYPIRKMHLVDDYDASDDASCADDNTSSFNYRLIAGTPELSNHAYGLAIDINPFENPYCLWQMDVISPDGSERFTDRSLQEPYMIHNGDLCYQLFESYGWTWGGHWSVSVTDYQHFEKPDALWQ